jgi:uncharacterized protein YgbK (DUF1537 family)
MSILHVIADDVTGACDVGAELAAAGYPLRVAVDGDRGLPPCDALRVVNTQSRALTAAGAYQRVLEAVRRRPADLLLKKIDTALRGHLGAELEAAFDALGAIAAFVVPAIPGVGRVTRDGCQWFGGRPLAATEFARDPEGPGAQSSVAEVIARESRRRTEVIGTRIVRSGGLGERARGLMRAGAAFFVVDAETEADVALAVAAILELPRPLCLAGSVALARALAPHLAHEGGAGEPWTARRPSAVDGAASRAASELPALIVSGSLHPMAWTQIDGAVASGLAAAVVAPGHGAAPVERMAAAARACGSLAAGQSVVVAPARVAEATDGPARRATERGLADVAVEVMGRAHVSTLILIGGETAHAVLGRLGASELVVQGRVGPLIADAEIAAGMAAGVRLVIKGGSGGEPDALAALLRDGRCERVGAAAPGTL